MCLSDARSLLIHLRLQFQLLLAPVWLWGWLMAGGGLVPGALIGFIAYHVFLYGGVTAYNSYYDRDVGPVGGLEHPPPVHQLLLPFSLLMQAIGLALCMLINPVVVLLYSVFVVLSVLYSHPRIRLKARPFASLALVAFGQGVLVFASVWAAVRGSLEGIAGVAGILGSVTAALLILALYPLTQVYQVEEDAERGDRTLAVVWGRRACAWFAIACTVAGTCCMLVLVLARFGAVDAGLILLGLVVQIVLIVRLSRTLASSDNVALYRRVTHLTRFSASALGAYLLARLTLS